MSKLLQAIENTTPNGGNITEEAQYTHVLRKLAVIVETLLQKVALKEDMDARFDQLEENDQHTRETQG